MSGIGSFFQFILGNGPHKYLSSAEAAEILGHEKWATLKAKLERCDVTAVDFTLFSTIIRSKFERIVRPVTLFCSCSSVLLL